LLSGFSTSDWRVGNHEVIRGVNMIESAASAPESPERGTPPETPERLSPAETPERLTPAEPPERLTPEEQPERRSAA
jgi:hypothetical protein